MNNSIRDIAREASEYCISKSSNAAWEWEDKFAELIIRKCADISDEVDTLVRGTYILKYFGLSDG